MIDFSPFYLLRNNYRQISCKFLSPQIMEDPGRFVSPVQRRPGVETPHQLDTVPVEVDTSGRRRYTLYHV